MARENFYILLDLDPAESDPTRIEDAIVAKQREWVSLRTHPSKGTWASGCLAWIPIMRRVMRDEPQRKAEAEEAKRLLLTRQKEQFTDLDEALKVLATKGYVFEKELEDLLKRESFKAFKIEEVKDRLMVPLKKGEILREQDKTLPLDNSIAKKIEGFLQLTGKKDLYDFLGLQRNSSLAALQSKTAGEYTKARLTDRKDALLMATQELIGHCKSLFKDEDSRKSYDKTLDLQRFKSLDKLLEIAGMDREITVFEFMHLVSEGQRLMLGKEEASQYIKEYATNKKWSIQLPDKKIENQGKVQAFKAILRELIGEDEIKEVILRLERALKPTSEGSSHVMILKRSLKASQQASSKGIITRDQLLLEENKIVHNLITFLDDLDVEDLDTNNLENGP